jgi:hypothetical protein
MRGDTAAVRRLLGTSAPFTFDVLLPVAALRAEIGDSAVARAWLAAALESLPWDQPGSVEDVARAGALIRAMALYAELAAAANEPDHARTWARAVLELWSSAEPAVEPVRARMRRLLDA